MGQLNRRDAAKLMAGAGAAALIPWPALAAGWINSVVAGVQIGSQSYSFRDKDLGGCIAAFKEVKLGECELSPDHVEPQGLSREQLRDWRLKAPAGFYEDVRKRFNDAGVRLYAYSFGFRKDMPDDEMRTGFFAARALGVQYITTSTKVSLAPAINKLAEEYKITVGYHGHDNTRDPDEFSTADTFARALQGASRYSAINLDIGHFVAANGDPVAFIKEHHDRIVTLHIKDRKKNHGDNMPFGEGDTPIVAVLQLLRDKHWKIPANIEYEYGKPGMDSVVEVKKCYAYCKQALES